MNLKHAIYDVNRKIFAPYSDNYTIDVGNMFLAFSCSVIFLLFRSICTALRPKYAEICISFSGTCNEWLQLKKLLYETKRGTLANLHINNNK